MTITTRLPRRMTVTSILLSLCTAGALLTSQVAAVDYDYDPEFSYEGETLTVVIRSNPGGGYDFWGRLVARHIVNHLPGNPDSQAVNRPGAGGLIAMNYMYNEAPKDGTEILMATREFAVADRINENGVRYETLGYPMLGSTTSESRIWLVGPDSPYDSLSDIAEAGEEVIFSAAGIGDGSYQMVVLLTEAGYPVRVATGYEGTGAQLLAVLRGEVTGFAAAYPSQRQLIADENLKIIAKLGSHLDGEVEDIRDIFTGEWQQLAEVLSAPLVASRPFLTAPGTPPERVEILQNAFRSMMNDPAFIAEAEQAGQNVLYTPPEEMERLYRSVLNASDEIMERL